LEYYLAIDIGASSGRHMLGSLHKGKLELEEVYRFPNEMENRNGTLCWDVEKLFNEIVNGLKKCAEVGKVPTFMGIDTWGVDFVLLDKDDQLIGDAVGYRDDRTIGMDELVYQKISLPELYSRTGIQKLPFNTVYQLMAVKTNEPNQLKEAKSLLMIPEYFNFLLTGFKTAEYTNATSTQLVNAHSKEWDYELMELLGYPTELFQKISEPGESVGMFSEAIQKEVGFNCEVILPATHDTASAVVSVPSNEEDTLYLSSGTWSLMGIERLDTDCSLESMKYNFTHEGGYDYRFRYLKNIMGLWMIQSLKRELNDKYSFEALCEMASVETISSIVDCQDPSFLAPDSMISAIQKYCKDNQPMIPQTPGELAAVIYNSLAECYAITASELEKMTGREYKSIHIIGGGANAEYLNKMTAQRTGKNVYAGPIEATAIGNIVVQMLATGKFTDLKEARQCIYDSFEIKHYEGANEHVTRTI